MKRTLQILILTLVILTLAFGAYWYFFLKGIPSVPVDQSSGSSSSGFSPFGRTPVSTGQPTDTAKPAGTSTPTSSAAAPIPMLRLLSSTAIGGYGASTTASTTVVRWIDRGRGNVYEASENSLNVATLSNTIVPRIFMSAWNKDLTGFIGSMFTEGSRDPSTVYASLIAQAAPKAASSSPSSSDLSLTRYTLKGTPLPSGIIGYAQSPKKDRVFFMVEQNDGTSAGYVASTNGTSMSQIFTTPLTQVNVDWPSDNVISITTKGSADQGGYLYFVNPKTGTWTKVLGPLAGLSARVSHDAKYAIVSVTGSDDNVLTSVYSVQKGSGTDAVVRTLADKCTWGNFYRSLVYCAVPSQQIAGTYPDDWYKGNISFIDKIWQINADTGELHLVSSIVDQSDRLIDAFNLGLDPKDNYLFFMNKNDLSFWSLDLIDSTK